MSGSITVSPRPGELDDHARPTVKRSGLSAICATRTTPLAFCCQESFPANCFDTDTILSLPGKAQGSCTGTDTRHGARARARVTGTGTGHRHGHGHGHGHVITPFFNHFNPFQSFQLVTFLACFSRVTFSLNYSGQSFKPLFCIF